MTLSEALSEKHARQLFEESSIDPEVARERGYRTVRRRDELVKFPKWQRRLGLYVPTYSPDGETTGCLLRADKPRKPKQKYDAPKGSQVILDAHPRARGAVSRGEDDLFVVEGIKKADSLLSRGATTIALTSVWMAHVPRSKPKKLLPCWDHVNLSGRRVFIVFDSDWRRNETVHAALQWLVDALVGRGADVRVAYLEDAPDGSKVGADDFLTAGGTIAELKALCRRFEPQDVGRIRISKDEKLRALSTDLRHTFWQTEWKGMGAHSSRDVYLKLIEAAERYGKIHPEGLRVKKAQGPLALEVKVSGKTLWKALNRLEEWKLLRRDNEGRKADRSGAFVLFCQPNAPRAKVSHEGGISSSDGKSTTTTSATSVTSTDVGVDAGDLPLRAPRLMWSRPKFTPRKGLVSDTRKVRQAVKLEPRDAIKRMGKIRGAIVDALEVAGGTLSLGELADILHCARPRDIRRRLLPMLEDAGIVDVGDGIVALTNDWLEALDEQRRLGKEIDSVVVLADSEGKKKEIREEGAETIARRRYKLKSKAFRDRLKETKSAPSEAGKRAVKESRAKRAEYLKAQPDPDPGPPPPLSPLAVAIRDYLERCPRDARHPPGWIGSTLWALDLYDGKPTPEESKAALRELGGAAYLEERLQAARRSA
jgi:hypothetical protein